MSLAGRRACTPITLSPFLESIRWPPISTHDSPLALPYNLLRCPKLPSTRSRLPMPSTTSPFMYPGRQHMLACRKRLSILCSEALQGSKFRQESNANRRNSIRNYFHRCHASIAASPNTSTLSVDQTDSWFSRYQVVLIAVQLSGVAGLPVNIKFSGFVV